MQVLSITSIADGMVFPEGTVRIEYWSSVDACEDWVLYRPGCDVTDRQQVLLRALPAASNPVSRATAA